MKKTLKKISEIAIKQADFTFSEEQIRTKWLGNAPASAAEIKTLEEKLGLSLPADYTEFLSISNGFTTPNENVEPSLSKTQDVGYLKDVYPDLIEGWSSHDALADVAVQLSRSILVGGLDEEQIFLLIPPFYPGGEWTYWKFASWIPGEDPYEGMENYFINVLDFLGSA